jgi:hypothetical protein
MNPKKLKKSGKYTSLQGTFNPQNPDKYVGESKPKFKSKLELKLMCFCDKSPIVTKWSYERIIIPYTDKSRNNSRHNYYIDCKMTMTTKEGEKTFLIEVKSKKETIAPVKSPRKKPENYRKEVETWVRNRCKWEAATKTAKARGWEFKILTEDQLK